MKIRINLTEAKKAVDPKQVAVDKKAEAKKVADKKKDDKKKVEDKKKKATKDKLKESLRPLVQKMLAENSNIKEKVEFTKQVNKPINSKNTAVQEDFIDTTKEMVPCPECDGKTGGCPTCNWNGVMRRWVRDGGFYEEGTLNEIDPALIDWSAVAAALGAIGLAPFAIDKIHSMWKKKFPKSFEKAQGASGALSQQAGGNAPGDKEGQIKTGQF